MLDQAFDTLASYDWGMDPKMLSPIDDAIVASQGDIEQRTQLERRLVRVLESDAPQAAKDYAFRKLRVIGTAASVGVLAGFLLDPRLSHMARYALESIPAAEAGQALRNALPKATGKLKIGVMTSLGARQDEGCISELAGLISSDQQPHAVAAAHALGAIRTPAAAEALSKAKPQTPPARAAVSDASLACAEKLLAAGDKLAALTIYKGLAGETQPKHVRLAATRGMLACASQ